MADNLLDKASILLTPTAYNDGSMLSVKPENGDGDFTFSRGSAATRVNAQGLVENVQTISSELVSNGNFSQEGSELVTNGDFVTDSDWVKGTGWSISDGKLNAISVNSTSATQSVSSFIGKSFKVTYTISDYSQGEVRLFLGGAQQTLDRSENGTFTEYITITSGNSTLYIQGVNNFTGSIDNVSVKEVGQDWSLGTGWSIGDGIVEANNTSSFISQSGLIEASKLYRLTFEARLKSGTNGTINAYIGGSNNKQFTIANTDWQSFTYEDTKGGSGADSIYFNNNGTELELDNISVKEITDDTDLPRIDYTDGCGSWLLETQSTNLITQSELFSDSSWVKTNSSITSNLVISPDGALNADKLVEDASTGEKFTQTIRPVSNTTIYTASVFVKFAGREWIRFTDAQSSNRIHFNTKTGVFGAVTGTVISYNSIALDNGWYKLSLTTTSVATAYAVRIVLAENDNDVSYTGDGTSGVYVWGAQLEEQSYATSYIPTNGAIATRLADVAANSGNSTLINSTEGVLYAEISALADDGTYRFISASSGAYTNSVRIGYFTTSNVIEFRVVSGGVNQGSLLYTLPDSTETIKVAGKYKQNDFALWVDGVEVLTDTNGSVPIGLSELSFDDGNSSNNSPFFGNTKCVAVFSEALTDAQLQSLTTI